MSTYNLILDIGDKLTLSRDSSCAQLQTGQTSLQRKYNSLEDYMCNGEQ